MTGVLKASVGMAVRTNRVTFEKLIPDAARMSTIRGEVERVHRCTLHAARCWPPSCSICMSTTGCSTTAGPDCNSSDSNWLLNAYNEVTYRWKRQRPSLSSARRATPFQPTERRSAWMLGLRFENRRA